ncbi:MAG TPA: phospholipid carrier-dependent glycosyltransferase, partial [Anaerolineales bacterium]
MRITKLNQPHRVYWYLGIAFLSAMGVLIVGYATAWGAALSDDSYDYISSARNLLSGQAFDLTAKVPPGLPLFLSLIGLFKVDPLVSMRWLNALLFGVSCFFAARIVFGLTKSYLFSLLEAFLVLISSTLIMVHSWAMSEPLFIFFTLSAILVYTVVQDRGSWSVPLFTGLLFGLAAATRYVGVALLLAGGTFWLTEAGTSARLRMRNTLIFSLVGILPLLAWVIRNLLVAGRLMSQVFGYYPISRGVWIEALNTIFLWFIPGRFVHGKELYWLGGCLLVLAILVGYALFKNRLYSIHQVQTAIDQKPALLIGLGMVFYMIIVILSRLFVDGRIPMDERLLSPLLMLGLILLVWFLAQVWRQNKGVGYGLIGITCAILIMTNLIRSVQMVQSYHQIGRGYASARDHVSETYAYLRNRPDIPVYSNAWVAIYFWTGRVTDPIPSSGGIAAMKVDMSHT